MLKQETQRQTLKCIQSDFEHPNSKPIETYKKKQHEPQIAKQIDEVRVWPFLLNLLHFCLRMFRICM